MKNLYQLLLALSFFGAVPVMAQVPVFSSNPSAPATIFLDFDGHYLEGSSWNMNGPITCGPSGMNATQITEVYKRVAEDYRPFDINVTTDSTKYWTAPANQRMRIILTTTSSWYGAAGGVSYVQSFTWGDNTPAFVFTALLKYSAKNVAEAASHEAGHTLGLQHQAAYTDNCSIATEYNPGVGSGEIGWAPIMGVGYYRNFTLWNNGANPYGCTNFQNDLDIITKYNGFTYRKDDYSSDFAKNSTAQAKFTNNKFEISGIIETSADADVVRFDVAQFSNFALTAYPFNLGDGYTGANLDMQVDLMTSSKNVIGSYNPADKLQASLDTMLNAGTYYLRVQGKGNVYAPQYASLGSYTLQAQLAPGTVLPLHDLTLNGRNENNNHVLNWSIAADEALVSQSLEASDDRSSFIKVAPVQTRERSFSLPNDHAGVRYFRLHIVLENNREYYSNIIQLAGNNKQLPSLQGTMVRNNVSISSPSAFAYSIIDFNGRKVANGNLQQGLNKITTADMGSGMYIIRYSNGQQQHTERFIKQ